MRKIYNWFYPILYSETECKDTPYVFLYDTVDKEGTVILWDEKSTLEVSWSIARKINTLLFHGSKIKRSQKSRQLKNWSNCHITANYLADIDNELWNIHINGITDQHWVFNREWKVAHGLVNYDSIEDAISENDFPCLIRFTWGWWWDGLHSIVVLGRTKWDKKIVWFEQAWYQKWWNFIDVQEALDLEKAYVKHQWFNELRIEIFSKSLADVLPLKK
jgi:hypothetical protein